MNKRIKIEFIVPDDLYEFYIDCLLMDLRFSEQVYYGKEWKEALLDYEYIEGDIPGILCKIKEYV